MPPGRHEVMKELERLMNRVPDGVQNGSWNMAKHFRHWARTVLKEMKNEKTSRLQLIARTAQWHSMNKHTTVAEVEADARKQMEEIADAARRKL